MRIADIETYDDLCRYLRYFSNEEDAPGRYDFMAAYRLFLAIVANLQEHGLKAAPSQMANETTAEHAEFLNALMAMLPNLRRDN